MCVRVYVSLYTHVCVRLCMRVFALVYVQVHTWACVLGAGAWVYVCMRAFACTSACMRASASEWVRLHAVVCINVRVCTFASTRVCTRGNYVCVCTSAHVWASNHTCLCDFRWCTTVPGFGQLGKCKTNH